MAPQDSFVPSKDTNSSSRYSSRSQSHLHGGNLHSQNDDVQRRNMDQQDTSNKLWNKDPNHPEHPSPSLHHPLAKPSACHPISISLELPQFHSSPSPSPVINMFHSSTHALKIQPPHSSQPSPPQSTSQPSKNPFGSRLSRSSFVLVYQNLRHFPYLRVAPVIPALAQIPQLSRKSNFDSWDNAIRGTLASMSLLQHICDPSLGFVVPPGFTAGGPSKETVDDPTVYDMAVTMTWWRDDQIVTHVLRSRISPDITASIVLVSGATAKDLYAEIYYTFSARDWHSGKAQWNTIIRLRYGGSNSEQQHFEYCRRWRTAFMKIRSTRYPLPVTMAIDQFLKRIPDAVVPFCIIKTNFYNIVHTLDENDPKGFLRIVGSVEASVHNRCITR